MSIIRTNEQAALQEVLVACKESAHHLDEAAEFAERQDLSDSLRKLAEERRSAIAELERALSETGDLPAGVDPDKESLKDLLHRLRAALSPEDSEADFIRQRLEAESDLKNFVEERNTSDLTETNRALLTDLAEAIDSACQRLRSMHARLSQ